MIKIKSYLIVISDNCNLVTKDRCFDSNHSFIYFFSANAVSVFVRSQRARNRRHQRAQGDHFTGRKNRGRVPLAAAQWPLQVASPDVLLKWRGRFACYIGAVLFSCRFNVLVFFSLFSLLTWLLDWFCVSFSAAGSFATTSTATPASRPS